MRIRSAAGLIAAMLVLPAVAQERAAVPAELEARVREFEAAFSAHDAEKVGALFAPEGSLINPMGERADGREAVTALFRKNFEGVLKGAKARVEIQRARLVTPEVALVDIEQQLIGGAPPPGAPRPWTAHVVVLLAKQGGGDWMMLDARPYFFVHRPAGKPGGKTGARVAPAKR